MGRGKKKFKRRANSNRKAKYLAYRTSDRATKNKIRRHIKRIYGLVLARSPKRIPIKLRQILRDIVEQRVKTAIKKSILGNGFTKEALDKMVN
jgi:hypothetical protein